MTCALLLLARLVTSIRASVLAARASVLTHTSPKAEENILNSRFTRRSESCLRLLRYCASITSSALPSLPSTWAAPSISEAMVNFPFGFHFQIDNVVCLFTFYRQVHLWLQHVVAMSYFYRWSTLLLLSSPSLATTIPLPQFVSLLAALRLCTNALS